MANDQIIADKAFLLAYWRSLDLRRHHIDGPKRWDKPQRQHEATRSAQKRQRLLDAINCTNSVIDYAHDCLAPKAAVLYYDELEALQLWRCDKCPPCKLARAKRWMARGIAEGEQSPRVWSLTCTLPPTFFWARPKHEWRAATLQEGQLAMKRFRERIRESDERHRTFRFLTTPEVHNAKRVPDGKPTDQTGHFHLHILIFEIPGMPLRKREIELAWCKFPKFFEIPTDAEQAIRLAERRGWKLGHVECHLERTTLPEDAGRSNAYMRPLKEGVGYSLKYLFKEAYDEAKAYDLALANSDSPDAPLKLPEFESPQPVRTSLFFGTGCLTALGLEARSRLRARITRRETKQAATAANNPAADTASEGDKSPAPPQPGSHPHCHVGIKEQGPTPWNPSLNQREWMEEVMRPVRERYATQRQPKVIAAVKAMIEAQGP